MIFEANGQIIPVEKGLWPSVALDGRSFAVVGKSTSEWDSGELKQLGEIAIGNPIWLFQISTGSPIYVSTS